MMPEEYSDQKRTKEYTSLAALQKIVIVNDGKKAVIIDASFGGELILRKIKELELQAVAILSTHRHFDHNMDNTFLKSRLSIPVLAHRVSPIEKDKEFDDGDELQFGDIR